MKTEIKERSDINGVNDVINLLDKKVIKSSKNNNLINNFNINIYTPKVQFPESNKYRKSKFEYI